MSDETTTQAPESTTESQSAPQTPASGATFTQADIDRIVTDRVKREREATLNKVLKELGVETLDSAAAALKAAKEREDAELTEIDRLKKERDDLANKEKAYIEQIKFEQRQRLADARNSVVKSALQDARATNADRVFKLLSVENADALNAVMGDDGEIDKKAVETLVKEAQKEYAEFFRSGSPGSPSNANGRIPEPSDAAAREANFRRARRGY